MEVSFTRFQTVLAISFLLTVGPAISGCKSAPPDVLPHPTHQIIYPARPATAAPAFKIFHHTADTLTLVTKPDATNDEITALLFQLRDAAHARAFDTLHIDQKFVDARKPTVWFHIYRGPRCAAEKYAAGPLPCGASYHAAGDYTLGSYANPLWDEAELLTHTNNTDQETPLWDPAAPYTPPPPHP